MKSLLNRVWKFLVGMNETIDRKSDDFTADYAFRNWILLLIGALSIGTIVLFTVSVTFFFFSLVGWFGFGNHMWWFAIPVPFAPMAIWRSIHLLNHSSWHLHRNIFIE